MPVLVYISHARQDEPLCRELMSHLASLMRPGRERIRVRTRDVPAGCDAEATRRAWLDEAQLVLLLMSADYIAECQAEEERAIERWRAGRAQVIPILVRDLHLRGTYEQVARLSPLPDNRVAVTKWERRDEAWANVVRGIDRTVEALERRQSPPQRGRPAPASHAHPCRRRARSRPRTAHGCLRTEARQAGSDRSRQGRGNGRCSSFRSELLVT